MKMMKRAVWMMLGLQTCLLAACTSDLNDPAAGGGNDLLELNFSIAATRTSLDDSRAGSFSEGDRVGLYIETERRWPTANSPLRAGSGSRSCAAATSGQGS